MEFLNRRIEDVVLLKACQECVADAGKEDDELVLKLYENMYRETDAQGKSWNYEMIDKLIENFTTEYRNLDGYYFRVQRDGKWLNICWSDLTESEMKEIVKDRDTNWLASLCIGLGKRMREIGDVMNISATEE